MLQERLNSIVEELGDVQTLPELKALYCFGQLEGNEYGDADVVPHLKVAVRRLRSKVEEPTVLQDDIRAQIDALQAQLSDMAVRATPKPPVQPIARGSKKYRLLKLDVSWSTKPQVHAIAAILGAHVKEGDVVDEADIVKMMVANEAVLNTRQGGRRIWDYYKGDHMEGLTAHGNVEKVL